MKYQRIKCILQGNNRAITVQNEQDEYKLQIQLKIIQKKSTNAAINFCIKESKMKKINI